MKLFKDYWIIYERRYYPDRIPSKEKRMFSEKGGKKLRIATAVCYRCHQAISNDQTEEFADKKDPRQKRELRNLISKKVKPIEEKALREWAMVHNLILDNEEFERHWKEQGEMGEAENSVWFDEKSQKWFKRNNLSYHSNWLEFFYRVTLHNEMFPEAPLQLEGFVETDEGLMPVFSQKHVKSERGASRDEVLDLMGKMGYENIVGTHDYYNSDKGIKIEDLHDENVLAGIRRVPVELISPVIGVYIVERVSPRDCGFAVNGHSTNIPAASNSMMTSPPLVPMPRS